MLSEGVDAVESSSVPSLVLSILDSKRTVKGDKNDVVLDMPCATCYDGCGIMRP